MLDRNDCRLRPMVDADTGLILSWRNQERIRANMYTDHIITPEEHERWCSKALHDEASRYLIFEWRGRQAGFVSVTAIDPYQQRATWAFYLGETNIPRGAGMAMEYLALEYVFETLGLRKLVCEVFAFNAPVIKMHTRFGFAQEALYRAHAKKGEAFVDVVALALFQDAWLQNKAALSEIIFPT